MRQTTDQKKQHQMGQSFQWDYLLESWKADRFGQILLQWIYVKWKESNDINIKLMFVLLGGIESLDNERCISCGTGKSIIFICVYGQD